MLGTSHASTYLFHIRGAACCGGPGVNSLCIQHAVALWLKYAVGRS